MTLPQKVGQLFTVYAYGADAATNRRLYGVVSRLPAPATQFPGNMALGAGRNLLDAFTAAQLTGRELRAVGIGQAWTPVADVNVNAANPVIGVRSFSSDPILTAGLTASQVLGFQLGSNTSAAAKHFPGHGDTNVDSHTGLPVINHTRAEWNRIDAPPFRAAVAAGVDAIVTAHIVVPALDPSGKSVLVTGWNSSVYNNVPALAGSLAARGASATALVTNLPTDAQIAAAVAAAGTTDLTVVLTSRAWDTTTADPGGRQQALIRALLATGRPVVVVAVRDPYDIAHLPGVTTCLTTYSYTAVAMESLAKVLFGVLAPRGKLPVSIPVAGDPATELYPFGHGLRWRVP